MRAEPAVEIVTFGCRLNTLESEVMRRHARAAALDDTVIVHTCAVTAEAERQARQAIRRLRRQRPGQPHRRDRLRRRRWRRAASPRCPRSTIWSATPRSCGRATWAGLAGARPAAAGRRHHGRARRRASSRSTASTGGPAPSCWSSRAATIAAPSAASPSAAARAAACRCRKSSPRRARCSQAAMSS